MSLVLRQNATHKVVLGPFVDVGDGFTPETGVALSSSDEAEVILHDNGTVVDISGYTWAAIATADGYYHLTLQTGITSTIGHMTVVVHDDSVCLPVKADFQIVEEAVYDKTYASGATGVDADWTNAGRLDALLDAIPTTAMRGTDSAALASVCTEARIAELAAANLPADVDTLLSRLSAARALLLDEITAVRMATLTDWINGGRLDSLLDAIKVVTDAITTTGTGLSAIPWNASWDAEVESEVNDALDTAISELGVAAPTATPTVRTGLMLLYMALRNKLVVQTSGTDALEIHNNAGTKITSKLLTDDGSDYTEAEMS